MNRLSIRLLICLTLTFVFCICFNSKISSEEIQCPNQQCSQPNVQLDYINYQNAIEEAGCENDGVAHYVCMSCMTKIDVTIKASGHDYVLDEEQSYQPTCTATGLNVYICQNSKVMTTVSRCETPTKKETVAALGHHWVETNRKNATCSEDGYIDYKCDRTGCNETKRETLNKTGHNYVETVLTKASCNVEGLLKYTCSNCQDSYSKKVAALTHNYVETENVAASCTTDGKIVKTCQNCQDKITESIKATGHNYSTKITKEATCTTSGIKTLTCSKCQQVTTETINSLGHNYKIIETIEATCSLEGSIIKICQNCQDKITETIDKLEHNVEFEITKQPTCLVEGLQIGRCSNCDELVEETIEALGHDFPTNWIIEEEATYLKEGLKYRICLRCNQRVDETIEKLTIPVVIPAVSAAAIGSATILFALKKTGKIAGKKVIKNASKEVTKDIAEEVGKDVLEPSFEEKTIITCLKKDDFYKSLKIQKHLVIVESDEDSLIDDIEENEASLALIDASDKKLSKVKKQLKELKKQLEEKELDCPISLIVSKDQIEKQKDFLEQLKKDELIKNYGCNSTNASVNLVKLVLPVMKPDLKSDEGLENISMVADALNIPAVSTLINMYINGREIKETIVDGKEDGLSFVDKATIISDLSSILGLDKISSVTGLVGDVDDIKSALQAKIGGNEIGTTKDAVSDIIDVANEIIDK